MKDDCKGQNNHTKKRMQQRGISQEQIDACIVHGTEVFSGNAIYYVLTLKQIKDNKLNGKWHGTVVVMYNGFITTTFINKNFKIINNKKRNKVRSCNKGINNDAGAAWKGKSRRRKK